MPSVQIRSFGGLNTDSHVQDLRNGDYSDAKNIEHISASEGESLAITPRKGNEFAFDIGEVQASDKVYSIKFPKPRPSEPEYIIRVANLVNLLNPTSPFDITITSPLLAIQQLETAFANSGYNVNVTLLQDTPEYTQYRLTPTPNTILFCYDYVLESVGSTFIELDVLQESVSTSRAGQLEVIGSYDLLGDLFVISSTKTKDPIDVPLTSTTFIGFTQLVVFLFPYQYINDLFAGQEMYVTGLTGSILANQSNGLYVISQLVPIPANNVIGAVCLYNSTDPQTQTVNGGIATLNPFGYGQIGVAQKNESKEEWKYTSLLSSKDLNLWVKYRCDVQGEISTLRRSIYFTDNYNVPKVFYYSIDAPYIQNGAIEALYPDYGTYDYGLIDLQTNHYSTAGQVFNIDYVSQDIGGALPAGNMRYFVRAINNDGSTSDWSLPSNPIPVYSEPISNPKKIKGDVAGTATSKKNIIRISGFNSDIIKKIQIAAISYLDIGVQVSSPLGIIATLSTTIGSNEIIYTHTGTEIGIDLIPEELSIQNIYYTTAKNNAIVDNRYLLSNLKVSDYDYSALLEQFTYSIEKKEITRVIPNINTALLTETFIYGGYQDPSNVFYNTGYMINETYRFGARLTLKNGVKSSVIKLFDVTIDTNSTSSDGKRVSGLADYSLVYEDTDPATLDKNLVPYVRIYYPDFKSVKINGYLASDLIERVEIFRVELDVALETIIGSGIAINCFDINENNPYSYLSPGNADYSVRYKKNTTSNYVVEKPLYTIQTPLAPHATPINASAIYLVDDFINAYDQSSVKELRSGDTIYNYGQPKILQNIGYVTNSMRITKQSVPFSGLQTTKILSSALSSSNDENNVDISGTQYIAAKKYGVLTRDQQRFVPLQLGIIDPNAIQGPTFELTQRIANFIPSFTPITLASAFLKIIYNGSPVVEYTLSAFDSIDNNEFVTIVNNSGGPISCSGQGGDLIHFYLNDNFLPIPAGLLQWSITYDLPTTPTFTYNIGYFLGIQPGQTIVTDNLFSNKTGYIVSYDVGTNNQIPNQLFQLQPPAPALQQPDSGIRYVQIKRDNPNQYSEDAILNYVYTGSYINSDSKQTSVDVLGGDTMTVTVFAKTFTMTASPSVSYFPDSADRRTQGLWFTAQSKKNIHLINNQEPYKIYPYSYADNPVGFTNWISRKDFDVNPYNDGYNQYPLTYGYRSNDPSLIKRNEYPTRIIYSDLKPQGSLVDQYRNFGLLSYADLDASFGEISDMKNINGELFTLQPNKYQRQFFNTRGTLQLSDTSQIVLGDASVLSRPGVTISSYGCYNKWSVIVGKSQGGNDIIYWYDKTRKKFIRFGGDGTVPLSDRALTRTISADGLKWLLNYDSATLNYGMHGVWNSLLGEAIWTVRAYREPDYAWFQTSGNQIAVTFNVGDITYLTDETNFINFEQTIVLYVVTTQHSSSLGIKPGVTQGWENYFSRPSTEDMNYYSIRTISFSEYKNRFNQFQETYHPKIYLPWKDTYLSPRPKDPKSYIYEHNIGDILRWYLYNADVQQEDGYIEVVFNIDQNTTKRYIALICNSEIPPYKLELTTKSQNTIIQGPEFEQQLEQFFAPIPNALLNGQTNLDNDFMHGQWIKIKFFYEPGVFQRLTNIVLKFNPMVRLWNT